MRERLDFSSISKIILDNMDTGGLKNHEYYEVLFRYALEQTKYLIVKPSDTIISRTISGERNVINDMITLYKEAGNVEYLKQDTENVLAYISDPAYVNEQLCDLLCNDSTVSDDKKTELSEDKESLADFMASCLLFGFSRNFISRDSKNNTASKKKSFLISDYLSDYHFPSVNRVFLGRKKELRVIYEYLNTEHCLFLEGIGGIGKSELAKQYGRRYKDAYEHVLFLRYTESLKKTITQLAFIDDKPGMSDDDLFRRHYRFFKQLPSDTLVILDNFDTIPEKEALFHEFTAMQFQLLVTTRSHIEEVSSYLVNEIEDKEELLELFYTYAPNSRNKPSVVAEIMEEVYGHTLTVEMAAKTLMVSDITPEELLAALRKEGVALSNPGKVKVTKDERTKSQRLYSHIQTLFALQKLAVSRIHTLRHMALVPGSGISKGRFHTWSGIQDYNSMTELIEYGWVQQDNENNRVSLHPFLHEVIRDFTKPSLNNCSQFLKGIYYHCFCYGEDVPFYHEILNTIESIFQNIEMDDMESAFLFFDKSIAYLGKYDRFDTMDKLLALMKDTIPMDKNHKKEAATYELYKAIVAGNRKQVQAGIAHLKKGLEIIQPIHEAYAETAANLYSNLGNFYIVTGDRQGFMSCTEAVTKLRERYQLPENHDSFVQKANQAVAYIMNGERWKADAIVSGLEKQAGQIPDFGVTLGGLYGSLGVAELRESPERAKAYFIKAREAYGSHLQPEDKEMKLMADLIQKAEVAIQLKTIGEKSGKVLIRLN